MGRQSQRKGAEGERELQEILSAAGYPVRWGGNKTYGSVPDLTGLRGIHIEAKRCEQVRISHWMGQAAHDAAHFHDGAPTVFHRRNREPWLVTMQLTDWLRLYGAAVDRDLDARFFMSTSENFEKGDGPTMETSRYWQEEPGKVIDTGKNVLEYYPRAMKLSIAKPSWTNAMGEVKRGKTVVLDLAAVKANPEAAAMFRRIADRMKEE